MKSYFPHYYEFHQDDWETFEELAKTVSVDAKTGRKTVEFNPEKFRQEGDFIISNDEGRLHLCFSDDEVVRVPEGVKAIAPSAFHKDLCPNVRHIILSDTVVGIAQYAICGCSVEELTINNRYIYISDMAFDWCSSLRVIHHISERVTIHVKEDEGRCARPVRFETMESSGIEDDSDFDPDDLPF